MGEDNLKSFHKWKNYEVILENHNVYVYPRISEGTAENQLDNHPKIHKVKAPIIEISSTMIRNGIKQKKEIRPLVSKEVFDYMKKKGFYTN